MEVARNMYKTEQEDFWAGEFGDSYIERNKDYSVYVSKLAFFAEIFSKHFGKNDVKSVIEFGSNIGLNLKAIQTLNPVMDLAAIEINEKAVAEMKKHFGTSVKIYQDSIINYQVENTYDLSMICGVLIHINPDELQTVYEKLYESSNKYILISEYYNPTPVEVSYRGNLNRLFKRDFAGEMMDKYPDLKLVDYGFRYHRDNMFPMDDSTWFILEKGVR